PGCSGQTLRACPTKRGARSRAVYFLCHFPSGCPDRALPGALPCGVRTFLPCSSPLRAEARQKRAKTSGDRLASCGGDLLSVGFLGDAVLFELLVQIAARRADHLRRLRDVPAVLAQLAEEKRPLRRILELAQGSLLAIAPARRLRLDADDVAEV